MITIEESLAKRKAALYSFEAVTGSNTLVAEEGTNGFRYRY